MTPTTRDDYSSGVPMSSVISDICEILDLLLFCSYFASQSKGKKFWICFFDVCYEN